MAVRFRDRGEAGQALAAAVGRLRDRAPVVLALPRGGVPVAAEVARALDAPLDVIVVRKLGVPFQPELGMGAIGEEGVRVLNADVIRHARIGADDLARVEARERAEVERRARRYRGGRPMTSLLDRAVIIVDDGIATGGTARAAIEVARGTRSCERRARGAGRTSVVGRGAVARRRRGGCRRDSPATCSRSASGTATSPRPPTTRCARLLRG